MIVSAIVQIAAITVKLKREKFICKVLRIRAGVKDRFAEGSYLHDNQV